MIRIRRRISGYLAISALAAVAALAGALLGFSPAQAHTVTAVLFPDGQGVDTGWTGTESQIDETGTPECQSGTDYVNTAADGARESVIISLASVPDGATLTSVDVQAYQRGDGGTGGTFQTYTRLNGGTPLDSGSNITVTSNSGCALAQQTINVADTVKTSGVGATTLEVGVVKGNTTGVRVGALRAIVQYNTGPSAPTLATPADVATTQDRTPTFDWNDDSVDPNDGTGGPSPTLFPTANGYIDQWSGDFGNIDESGTPLCDGSSEWTEANSSNTRDAFVVSLASVPNGATITSVDVQAWHRPDNTAQPGGTFRTFARLNGTNTDAGTDIAVGNTSACAGPATQTLNVADTAKAGGTTLEIGVLKTATDTDKVRVGALRAVVNYTAPASTEGPFTYEINRAPFVASACDWPNGTVDATGTSSTFTPGSNMSFGTHCWRVRALDHDGLAGPWGTHRTITIQATNVTAAITAVDKEYDGTTDAEYTCDVVGEDIGADVTCDGTHPATFDDANAGTGKTVTATGLALSGADAGDYNLTNTTDDDLADISKATLSVDAEDGSKVYGDDDPAFLYSLSGFVNGEDEMTAAGLDGTAGCTRAPGETVIGSPYEITCEPGTLVADNYDFETGATGDLTIEKATLSVDADEQTKDYGDADPELTYTLSGFANGEDETSAGVVGDAACDREPGQSVAGSPYTITCEPGTLAAANYEFVTGDTGDLTIEAAGVSAAITAEDKVYDGTTDAVYTCEVVGAQSGDDVTCDGTQPGVFDDANVGTDKTVTANDLVLGGADAGNYALTNTEDTDEADISKATLSVDAENASKDYGDADPTFLYTLNGFVNGEDEMTAAGLTGTASCTRASGETVAGSPYEITCEPGTLVADNYDFETGDPGDFTINTATLSIDADDQTKDFGDPDPPLTYTFSGFADGEDETSAGVSGDAACNRAPGEPVAGSPYTITCEPGTLAAANYDFETGDLGELTIEGADVEAVITAFDKPYDGLVDAEYTCEVTGIQSGDEVTCDGDDPATFDDANVGTNKTVTATNLALSGADAVNYTLTNTTDTDEADIAAATLSVAAEDASKDYGDAEPEFTYTLSGFIAPDDETSAGVTGEASCDRAPGESVAGSPYTITCEPGTLTAANYTFVTGDTGDFTINTATLSVDADDQTKDFGDADPEFTYTLSGFADGEDETSAGVSGDAACDRAPGESVAGSPYTITCEPGTLTAANYAFATGDTGELTIEGADVEAVITAADKDYNGTTDAEYTCEVTVIDSGDNVTCDGDHPAAFDDANVGTGKTVTATGLALGGADAGNYTLTDTTDTDEADITTATLSVDADDASKSFGDPDPEFTYSLIGFASGEDETSAGVTGEASCTRAPGETAAGSPYTITCEPGTLSAANYDFQTGGTGDLTINPDASVPSVTIEQASGQNDPTTVSPIEFDVVFSEPVTGFDDDDIELSGSAGATTANVSGGGDTYTVSVAGMTTDGSVTVMVKAGAATDGTNNSAASTSADNTVTFDAPGGILPAKHLDMETKSSVRAGDEITVEIEDLKPGEAYSIKIDGEVVKTGTANSRRKVKVKVTVPLSLEPGKYKIQAIGSQPNREDTDNLRVKKPSDLDVELRRSTVTAGGTQRVSVDDLLRGEGVEVRYDGTLISPSDAEGDSRGEYTLTFSVGTTVGTHTVKVTGTYDGRTKTRTFKVAGG